MKKDFRLSIKDDTHHHDDVTLLVDAIIPFMVEFYKEFEITISGIKYDSQLNWSQKTSITAEFINPPPVFPELVIDISELGSGYLPPSRRMFTARVKMRGFSKKEETFLWKEFQTSTLSEQIRKEGNNPAVKLRSIIDDAIEIGKETLRMNDIYFLLSF
jgi:hypothetical protein